EATLDGVVAQAARRMITATAAAHLALSTTASISGWPTAGLDCGLRASYGLFERLAPDLVEPVVCQ
ncbi:MAG TPA: hypothetical protein VFL27_03415, partial [Candidatus Dormibacteraeota bacterium]|nr:hypothetical protein [Candidatus Dormibacteraeota bacterium]